jgi:hypothetical protein
MKMNPRSELCFVFRPTEPLAGPPNNALHRSRRSEFLIIPPMPFGGPVNAGVRRRDPGQSENSS